MEHNTFAKKTVVLAALGALSLMAATVRAADKTETPTTPETKTVTVTIGGDGLLGVASEIKDTSVTWDDAWIEQDGVLEDGKVFGGLTVKGTDANKTISVTEGGSLTIAFGKDANQSDNADVTFNGVNLTVKDGGTFSNSSYVKFTEGGSLTVSGADFTNDKDGVIAFEGTTFSLDAGDKDALVNFENAGLIVLDADATKTGATMNIGAASSNPLDVESEDKPTLNVGNVEIKSGTLTNYDKGYQVDKELDEQTDGEAAEGDETSSAQTLVNFGTVKVSEDGQFVNAAGALSSGTELVLEGTKTVKIAESGESVWNTLHLTKVKGSTNLSEYVTGSDDQTARGDFRVTSNLVIDAFASNGEFTIDGKTDDAKVFGDGINISAGSHVETTALKQENAGEGLTWNTDGQPAVGTLKLTGFAATFKEAVETPEDSTKAEEGEDEATTNGTWSYKKFGDVTAVNTTVMISGARPTPAQENTDPYAGNGYTPSLQMSSLTIGGTTMKIAYDVEVDAIKAAVKTAWDNVKGTGAEDIDMEGWTKENIFEQLETLLEDKDYAALKTELEGQRGDLEKTLAGDLTDVATGVNSTIKGSDLSIGTLTLAVKNETVEVELSDSESEGGSEDTTTRADEETDTDTKPETVTITGNETYGFKDLSLTVTDSNLDVGKLDLQTGDITLNGSRMMIGNVETLDGTLTLAGGYLGLNVTTSVTDDIIKTSGTTVEVGSPVTIGANGQLNFRTKSETNAFADGEETPAETEDHAIGFFTSTDIVFDGRNFNSEALFSQDRTDGKKGIVKIEGGSLTVKATNLSWGVYKLFDEDTLDTSALKDKVSIDTSSGDTVSGLWKDAVGDKISADGNEIVIGGKTIEGSGLDIGAVNLANSVVGGDRGSALDKALFNHILSNGKSLEEISNTINSITAMGAVAGLTAMTVDFGAYVTDQVEHHASTIPHQQEGWWVQGLAGKLKSDDLAVGGMKGGYSIDTVGIMGGFDKKLRNGDTIGVAASYQSGDADSEGEGLPVTTDVTNYGLHLWHARQFDAYRLMGMFSYSKTSGDAKMNYAGNELTSDLGATEISIGARADKEFQWGTVRMIPHAGVRASMIDVDDYTIEMGSEELFKVSEDKLWIFEVPVGVTFASSFEYARWNVQPYVDLTVRGRFGDTDSTFTLEGSNTSDSMKYDVTGDVIGDLRIGYMSTFQDLNLGMSYGLSAGDGGRQNHQLEATLRIDF